MPPKPAAALTPFEHAQELIRQYREGTGAPVRYSIVFTELKLAAPHTLALRALQETVNSFAQYDKPSGARNGWCAMRWGAWRTGILYRRQHLTALFHHRRRKLERGG